MTGLESYAGCQLKTLPNDFAVGWSFRARERPSQRSAGFSTPEQDPPTAPKPNQSIRTKLTESPTERRSKGRRPDTASMRPPRGRTRCTLQPYLLQR